MSRVRVPVLIVSGPVGVGKTSVAHEMFDQLFGRDITHAVIDLDSLDTCWPFGEGDPFNEQMAMRNLAAIWSNFATAGVDRAVIARVVESRRDLAAYEQAIPGAEIGVCQLTAEVPTLRERLGRREAGSSYKFLVNRAAELAESLERFGPADFVVQTGRRPLADIAIEALAKAGWLD